MKLLTSLILMTVSTFAFAERRIEPTFNSHFLITTEQHNELEAKYQALIQEVNASLSGPRIHQHDIVKATSESVAYKYIQCNSYNKKDNLSCEISKNDFIIRLSNDVQRTNEYQAMSRASIIDKYKDSPILGKIFTPMTEDEYKAAKERRKAEREESNKFFDYSLKVIFCMFLAIFCMFLAIPALALICGIVIGIMDLWFKLTLYSSIAYIYIKYSLFRKDEPENEAINNDESDGTKTE